MCGRFGGLGQGLVKIGQNLGKIEEKRNISDMDRTEILKSRQIGQKSDMVVTWKGYGEDTDRKSETCDSVIDSKLFKNSSSEMSTSGFESQTSSYDRLKVWAVVGQAWSLSHFLKSAEKIYGFKSPITVPSD